VSHAVDLLINCYERTYREVLTAERFAAAQADNVAPVARRTALVNNVLDRADAQARADALIAAGGLDAVFFVEDHLDDALARTGLTREDLGPVPYFTDWALVAACLPGPEWLLHWDAEVRLRAPLDWVTPAIALMERDARVLVANPNWPDPTLDSHTLEEAGPFALGHGFSDQVFLARRSELARPIYRDRTLARLRYPVAHLGTSSRPGSTPTCAGRAACAPRTGRPRTSIPWRWAWPTRGAPWARPPATPATARSRGGWPPCRGPCGPRRSSACERVQPVVGRQGVDPGVPPFEQRVEGGALGGHVEHLDEQEPGRMAVEVQAAQRVELVALHVEDEEVHPRHAASSRMSESVRAGTSTV
jgi:hypothetical protein